LKTDDRGSKPYKVEAVTGSQPGKSWGDEGAAIRLYDPPAAADSGVPSASDVLVVSKKQGVVGHFDVGLCFMDRPLNISAAGSCDVGETIGIIGALCRIAQLTIKKKGVSLVYN